MKWLKRLFHHHHPARFTGREIKAEFGKKNLPHQAQSVHSRGLEAWCSCGSRLIVHLPGRFRVQVTELETR